MSRGGFGVRPVPNPPPQSSIRVALTDDKRAVVVTCTLQAPPAGATEQLFVVPALDKARALAEAITKLCDEAENAGAGRIVLARPGDVQ